MKIDLHYGNGVLAIPAAALEKLSGARESELRVLLLLGDQCERANAEPARMAKRLGLSSEEVLCAIEFWRGAGLLSKGEKDASMAVLSEHTEALIDSSDAKSDEQSPPTPQKNGVSVTVVRSDDGMPHYTAEEIDRIFAKNGHLSGMIDECQNIFGKIFNPTEINRLMALTDYFRLDCEYILVLAYYCKKNGKASVPYLDKLARSLYNEGIDHVDLLGERLGEMDAAKDLGNYYRSLSGAGKRAFTDKENRFLNQWVKWSIAPEVLRIAYEIAVDNTGSPSMPYINKVLSNWKEAGYTTAEQVKTAIEEYKQKKEGKTAISPANSSFTTDEFFEAALKRSLALYESESKS